MHGLTDRPKDSLMVRPMDGWTNGRADPFWAAALIGDEVL